MDLDFQKMTTEELAATIRKRFEADLVAADLENNAPKVGALKYLRAVRLIAKENPQLIADALVALTIDIGGLSEEGIAEVEPALPVGLPN